MKIEHAIESIRNSLFWGTWSTVQADALRTLLLEVEKVKTLEEENDILRKQINKITREIPATENK